MTSKKPTFSTRQNSSRFYVYTTTLTQCTLIALLLTPSTAQIQVIPKIMGQSPSVIMNTCSFKFSDQAVERTTFPIVQQGLSSTVSSFPELKISASYANEKSSMISVTFDEGRGMPRSLTIVIVIFLLFAIIPVFLMACKTPKYTAEIPKSVEGSTSNNWSKEQNNWVRGDNSMALNPKGNVNGVRSEHESRQRDKERRTHWNKLQPDEQCVRFGTREYTARLRNLPLFTDWTKICRNTEANVHGVSLKPSYCKNKVRLRGNGCPTYLTFQTKVATWGG